MTPERRRGAIDIEYAFGFVAAVVGLLLICMRLTGLIGWPWWLVLSPIWGTPLLVFVVFWVLFGIMDLPRRT